MDVIEFARLGGIARAESMSDAELKKHGRKMAKKRWDDYRADHPEARKRKNGQRKKAA